MKQLRMTLKRLLQTALGAKELTKFNISLLHGVINCILKKLVCDDEIIYLDGHLAECVEKLLSESKQPMVPFTLTKEHKLQERLDQMDTLQARIYTVENKLEEHIHAINRYFAQVDPKYIYIATNTVSAIRDEKSPLTPCDRETSIACHLISNRTFQRKLARMIFQSIFARFFILEDKIAEFNTKFENFVEHTYTFHQQMSMVPLIIKDLEALEVDIYVNDGVFFDTMLEVQDFIDGKAYKMIGPDLKNAIAKDILEFEDRIYKYLLENFCPKPIGTIKENVQCLLCSSTKVAIDVGTYSPPLLPNMHPIRPPIRKKRKICNALLAIHKKEEDEKLQKMVEMKPVEYMEGSNGYYFRKGC